MVEGAFKALIPEGGAELVPSVLIVPLVAFDRRGFRLGYGGGFYDRTLEGLRARGPVTAIGFGFAAQEMAEVPIEPTDQRLDLIVTERSVLRF
jgi:5-formyltetrahydrofolate cyclo-ligase